jgi:CRISPR-associated protein Csb1
MSESTNPPIALGFEVLQAAVAGNVAAIRAEIPLEPAGGWQDKVFPPTYSGGVYATEKRLLDGKEVETVVLDSVQSQANRLEEALLRAFDEGRVNLPVMEMTVPDYGRVTSLDAPHRIADAIFRDALLDGVPFHQSPDGKRFLLASVRNATAVFELCPTALVFGYWNSHAGLRTRGATSRLFSALVDGWASIGQPGEGEEALEWLERQTPPALAVSESSMRDSVEAFVPVNDEESLPAYRLRQSRYFPSVTPEEPDVYFIWPDASPTPVQVTALTALAAGVTYLGHSVSKVIVSAAENAPEPNFVPDASGNSVLRVPAAGRFRSLCQAWGLDRRPSVGRTHAYRRLGASSQPTSTAASEFTELFLFRRVEGRTLMLEQTLILTEAVRGTLLKVAPQPAAACLHGHSGDTHVALFPLAFVGRTHADGHIMGFAVALPKSLSKSERSAALAAAAALSKTKLEMGRLGDWVIERVRGDETSTTLQSDTWIRPARRLERKTHNSPPSTLFSRIPAKNRSVFSVILLFDLRV